VGEAQEVIDKFFRWRMVDQSRIAWTVFSICADLWAKISHGAAETREMEQDERVDLK
jgi:hypothetical protein